MKSKLTTYLLIVVVAVVWGVIIKKVFFSKPSVVPTQHSEVSVVVNEKTSEPLMLNYRDPFRPAPVPRTAPVVKEEVKPKPKPLPKSKEKVSLKFIGYLQCGDAINYIVELNGRQHSLSPGEEADGFCLSRVCADSLYFTRKEVVYSLALE